MTRHIFIVSQRHHELCAYLKQRFADDETVDVILDRRRAEHQEVRPCSPQRRRTERRRRLRADTELRVRSHTVITIPQLD
jgi:hypothetical protein